MEKIVSPEQSAFIAGRQILDGPLMLSECIDWYKKKSKKLMIFKVNFEKAYNSISWKYLDFILQSLGFGLHLALKEAVQTNLIQGATVGDSCFRLSYFYMPMMWCLSQIGGGDESNRKLAWVKWDNMLASFDKGGLGVGSLKAFNLALLQKWHWRLINNANLLWVRLINLIHGVEAGLDEKGCKSAGLWSRIIGTVNYLHSRGVIPREKYNRLFHLDRNGDCVTRDQICNGVWSWDWCRKDLGSRNNEALVSLLSDIGNIVVDSGIDTCSWNIATDGIFSVGVTRNHIDNHMLPSAILNTRWNNVLPRKVNIFVWRFLLDRLPRRLNLSSRGLEITLILCPVCNVSIESSSHLFFHVRIGFSDLE
ncbi:RNA-directed DNA polymerase, eukaryota, reverse transcriptase zinc-binding domain protein [Tanacetum coccineum]